MTPIRVLVVDDELPARQRLTDLLRDNPLVGEILEAGNGVIAVEIIERLRPELVFLDMQMPELDGFGVIDEIGAESMPLTVFVTAYDQHAIRAFEAHALDYLLKPFSDERHEATMLRVRSRLEERNAGDIGQRMIRMANSMATVRPFLDRVAVRVGAAGSPTLFLRVAEIDWIEAAGVYVNLHAGGKVVLHRATLNDFAAKLDPRRFIRIHRSAIVNIESVVQLEPLSHGDFEVLLKDGSRPRLSRTYRALVEERLGQPL